MINSTNVFFGLFFGALAIAITIILLWHILHIILCKKYDELLFKQPYFRPTELAVYSSWPMSLFRSMSYILLIGTPSLATKRRFKGVRLELSDSFFLVLICRTFLFLVVLDILLVSTIIVWGAVI